MYIRGKAWTLKVNFTLTNSHRAVHAVHGTACLGIIVDA